jgi:hypothetical protein
MLKTTTGGLVRTSLAVAVMGGFAMMVMTANCGGSGSGRAGGGGTPGTPGVAGSTGLAGSNPTGGSGPANMCPSTQLLDCANPVTLTDGQVMAWSAQEWNNTSGKFCNASGVRGSIYSYHGVDDTLTQGSKVDSGALLLTLNVAAADYAGGGMAFDRCVSVPSTFNALQFTIALASGDITGCDWSVQVKTFEQFPTTQNPAGGCNMDTTSCYNFPALKNAVVPTATPQTVTIPISNLMPAAANPATQQQIVGFQWQVESGAPVDPDGGVQAPCMVGLRIDDIKFVTQ